jgi:hypothetical protein
MADEPLRPHAEAGAAHRLAEPGGDLPGVT